MIFGMCALKKRKLTSQIGQQQWNAQKKETNIFLQHERARQKTWKIKVLAGIPDKIINFEDSLPCACPLSHNSSCFKCNTAITNFLVLHTCEIRFHDVIDQSTIHKIPMQKF